MVCVPGRGTSSLWQVQETHTESCWTLTLHYVSKYKSLDVCDKMTSDNIEAYIVKKGSVDWSTNIRLSLLKQRD